MSDILFTPHHDDETLFASFTLIRERPIVVVCFPSLRLEYGDTAHRLAETSAALEILGAGPAIQWPGGDMVAQMRAIDIDEMPRQVWAPDRNASHPEHVAVANAARQVFGDRLRTFHTYRMANIAPDAQIPIKVRLGVEVPCRPEWVERKLAAMACYRSQIHHPRAYRFFLEDLREYEGAQR